MARPPRFHKSYKSTQSNINTQLKTVANNLTLYIDLINEGAKESLDEIGKEILDRSLAIAPEDTGELKESAYTLNIATKDSYTVEIGYTAEHAVFAHENANRGHDYNNPTTPGTHWQFLLGPASEVENEIAQRVADNIKEKIR